MAQAQAVGRQPSGDGRSPRRPRTQRRRRRPQPRWRRKATPAPPPALRPDPNPRPLRALLQKATAVTGAQQQVGSSPPTGQYGGPSGDRDLFVADSRGCGCGCGCGWGDKRGVRLARCTAQAGAAQAGGGSHDLCGCRTGGLDRPADAGFGRNQSRPGRSGRLEGALDHIHGDGHAGRHHDHEHPHFDTKVRRGNEYVQRQRQQRLWQLQRQRQRASGSGSTSGVTSAAELVAEQAVVDADQAQVTAAQQSLAQATIVSPINGTVASVGLSVGHSATADSSTENVIVVGQGGWEVASTVPVANIANVKVGDHATVLPDGVSQSLDGQVVQIGVAGTTSGTTTTYSVTIGFNNSHPALETARLRRYGDPRHRPGQPGAHRSHLGGAFGRRPALRHHAGQGQCLQHPRANRGHGRRPHRHHQRPPARGRSCSRGTELTAAGIQHGDGGPNRPERCDLLGRQRSAGRGRQRHLPRRRWGRSAADPDHRRSPPERGG